MRVGLLIIICFGFLKVSNAQSSIHHKQGEIEAHHKSIEFISASKALVKEDKRVTVLTPLGSNLGQLFFSYGPFKKINKIRVDIYNGSGEKIKSLKEKDLRDIAPYSGFDILDNRLLVYTHSSTSYPYSIEYHCEYEVSNVFYIQDWMPVSSFGIELSDASLTIKTKDSIRFRSNGLDPPMIFAKDNMLSYKWSLSEFDAVPDELYAPHPMSVLPWVQWNTGSFRIDGISGSCESWESFGSWCYELMQGRQELPNSTVEYLQENFGSLDTLERIKSIYRWMQGKTRYISIQLGIGGWQPISAADVDKSGYGDCKALVNYTLSALKAVGIPSYYSLVYAGGTQDPIIPKFTQNNFNHVILCIPVKRDTIWLECTNQKAPFNYLGSFTSNRKALIIRESRSQLVSTPDHIQSTDRTIRVTKFQLSGYKVDGHTVFTESGRAYDRNLAWLSKDDQQLQNEISELVNMSGHSVKEVKVRSRNDPNLIRISTRFELEDFIKKRGNMLVTSAGVFKSSFAELPAAVRRTDIYIPYNRIEIDSVEIFLPENMTVQHLPESQHIETPFGSGTAVYSFSEGTLLCYFYIQLNKGSYSRESYSEFREFVNQSLMLSEQRILLKEQLE